MKKFLPYLLLLFVISSSFSQEYSRDEIILFPNTASTQVNLLLDENVNPTDISVYDLHGRLIKKVPLKNVPYYTINTEVFPEGLYIVAVTTPNQTKIKKFLVDPNAINNYSYYDSPLYDEGQKISLVASSTSGCCTLSPLDDAYLQGSSRYNTTNVRVDGTSRTTYLKYDLSGVQGSITSASLKFTIASDAGSGTISVYKGSSTNWTETNLSTSNKPSKGALIGSINKSFAVGSEHSISLNTSNLGSSLISLVVVHSDGNDTDFASKEHATLPAAELVINGGGSSSGGSGNTANGTNLSPKDDAYLEGSSRRNLTNVRVDGTSRITYLKYDLGVLQGSITNADLKFTIASDAGSGTISVYKGNGTNWTETNLSTSNKPSQGALLGSINKTYSIGSTHSISLNTSNLGTSLLSLVVVHSGGNDTDFASKEHATLDPPQLVINGGGSSGGSGNTSNGTKVSPEDDAYLEGTARRNLTNVRVDGTNRITYLKYDLSSVQGSITSADLKFTIASDAGSGTISVYKGNGTSWNETNLSTSNKPSQGALLGSINKTYAVGSEHSISLNTSNLGSSLISLVVVHSGGNDTDFASKEHATLPAPELVINGGGSSSGGTNKGDEEFEFDITFNDINILLSMQSAINAAQRAAVDAWLRNQEDNFREEINRQLGTNHSSFANAQNDFFKNYEKNFRRVENVANSVASSQFTNARDLGIEQRSYSKELFYVKEWQFWREWCGPHNSSNCDNIASQRVQGTLLGSVSSATQLDGLWDLALADFENVEFQAAERTSWGEGIQTIVSDNSLLNTMINNHIAYYNQRNLQDKIFLMTAYLTQYNNRGSGPLAIPISAYYLPIFWDNNTLLDMGKQQAPQLTDSEKIFKANFFENEGERCLNISSSVNSTICFANLERLEELKDDIIQQHIDEISEAERIGIDANLSGTCAEDIIREFTLEDFSDNFGDANIVGLINTVFDALSSNGPVDVTYKSGNISGNGRTTVPIYNSATQKYEMDIILNVDLVNNGTKIAVAKTILHESIHAYLKYVQRTNPIEFNSASGDYSDLVAAYAVFNDFNYAQHVYMAGLVKQVGKQLEKYAITHLGYPTKNSDYGSGANAKSFFFEAVSWSGIGLIDDPTSSNPADFIDNPVFVSEYPSRTDRETIFNIFTAENTGSASNGRNPLIQNSCN